VSEYISEIHLKHGSQTIPHFSK